MLKSNKNKDIILLGFINFGMAFNHVMTIIYPLYM